VGRGCLGVCRGGEEGEGGVGWVVGGEVGGEGRGEGAIFLGAGGEGRQDPGRDGDTVR